jgi:predicted Zn-dependent protease
VGTFLNMLFKDTAQEGNVVDTFFVHALLKVREHV